MNKFHTFINMIWKGCKTTFYIIKGTFARLFTMATPQRALMILFALAFAVSPALAASNDITTGLNTLADDFKSYVSPVQKITYAIAAICAVVGAFTIYFKMSNGEQDVKKTIMLVVGGCAGLVALGSALPAMFGVTV